jgi:hypothetical protein
MDRRSFTRSYTGELGNDVGNGLIQVRLFGVEQVPHVFSETFDAQVAFTEDQIRTVKINKFRIHKFIFMAQMPFVQSGPAESIPSYTHYRCVDTTDSREIGCTAFTRCMINIVVDCGLSV